MIPLAARIRLRGSRPSVGWWRASRAAFAAGLGRPALWPFALLAFLLRGGWFLFLLPIVVFPSTVGVSTFIGPLAVTPAGPSEGFLGLVVATMGVLGAWLLVGGLVAAACEAVVILDPLSGGAGGRDGSPRVGIGLAARVLSARLVALIPLILAIAWSVPRTVGATYAQLITPLDPAVPLPVRVLRDVPDVIAIVIVAWLLAETIGALAARHVVLLGDGALEAVVGGANHLVRRPFASAATACITVLGSVAIVGPALVLAGVAWDRLAVSLPAGDAILGVLLPAMAFVLVWTVGLVLAAAAASWRGIAWTLEVVRSDRPAEVAGVLVPPAGGRLVESEGTSAAS